MPKHTATIKYNSLYKALISYLSTLDNGDIEDGFMKEFMHNI